MGVLIYYLRTFEDLKETKFVVIMSASLEVFLVAILGSTLSLYFAYVAYKGYNWLVEREGCEKI